MKSIAICIVVEDNLSWLQLAVNNIIRKRNDSNIRFYFYDNASTDPEIAEYCLAVLNTKLSEDKDSPTYAGIFLRSEQKINTYQGYNKLFLEVQEDYICVFPVDVLVNQKWATDLLSYAEAVNYSGIVGIRTGLDKTFISSLAGQALSGSNQVDDKMVPVWRTEDNRIWAPFIMKTETVKIIGGYNPKLLGTGFEQEELCWRFGENSFNNFYIIGQSCTKVGSVIPPGSTDGQHVFIQVKKEMITNKSFKSNFN